MKPWFGNSLTMQWLGLCTPTAVGLGSFLVGELKSYKPRGTAKTKKQNKKDLWFSSIFHRISFSHEYCLLTGLRCADQTCNMAFGIPFLSSSLPSPSLPTSHRRCLSPFLPVVHTHHLLSCLCVLKLAFASTGIVFPAPCPHSLCLSRPYLSHLWETLLWSSSGHKLFYKSMLVHFVYACPFEVIPVLFCL